MERPRAATIAAAVEDGRVQRPATTWLTEVPHAPADVAGVLALQPSGACVFHRAPVREPPGTHHAHRREAGGCAVHPWRPVSCEHFPFICRIDARGVRVTLSHFCPTAAALLVEPGAPVVVQGPPVLTDGRLPEGLDARESLPPLRDAPAGVRPSLMAWDEVTAWEDHLVQTVARAPLTSAPPELALFERARAAVPPGFDWPAAPSTCTDDWRAWAADAWPSHAPIVGRYLASKVHASWALYLGDGRDAVLAEVALARTVLQVESARTCAAARRPLDVALLLEAIRQSDRLLLHHADPGILAGGARI